MVCCVECRDDRTREINRRLAPSTVRCDVARPCEHRQPIHAAAFWSGSSLQSRSLLDAYTNVCMFRYDGLPPHKLYFTELQTITCYLPWIPIHISMSVLQ